MTGFVANVLLDPWSHGFMQRALLELILVGSVGAVIGTWAIFYELSYSAESLAHGLLPGLVIAAFAGIPLVIGGAVGVGAAALLVAIVGHVPEIGRDTSVAVVITALFGLGALLGLSPSAPPGLGGLLFGDPFGVSRADLMLATVLAVAALGALAVLHRLLLAVGFDRVNARALGANSLLADIALLVLLAVAIVIGVQGLGNLLVVAVVIAPAATARLFALRMVPTMCLGAVIATLGAALGLYLSYYADTAGGASVAIVMVCLYLATLAAVAIAKGTRAIDERV